MKLSIAQQKTITGLKYISQFLPIEQFKRLFIVSSFIIVTATAAAATLTGFAFHAFEEQTIAQTQQIERYSEAQAGMAFKNELEK